MKKRILLLGASGSIGSQTLDIIRYHSDLLELTGVSVYHNKQSLIEILKEFKVKYVYLKELDQALLAQYPHIKFYSGETGLEAIAQEAQYDLMVNALVGATGLQPCITAIENKKDIALANKESLVMAGDLINQLLQKHNTRLFPIDSEHSAIFQILNKDNQKEVKRLILTASGGSFRDLSKQELDNVTLEQALNHPTWKMGKKITIDSATLMNKANEIIEAHHLFNIPYDRIDVIIHKESIIHSMVEFNDGSVIAQLSVPDMRLPIQYALLYPKHLDLPSYQKLDFDQLHSLNFMPVDLEKYSLFKLIKDNFELGNNFGAYITGANDTLVEMFLNKQIAFIDIEKGMRHALKMFEAKQDVTFELLLDTKNQAIKIVKEYFKHENA